MSPTSSYTVFSPSAVSFRAQTGRKISANLTIAHQLGFDRGSWRLDHWSLCHPLRQLTAILLGRSDTFLRPRDLNRTWRYEPAFVELQGRNSESSTR